MISVEVETAALRAHDLIGPGQSIRKLARYLRPHLRGGMLNIYSVNPPHRTRVIAITVIGLANEIDAAACLTSLAAFPGGGIQGRRYVPTVA